MNKRKGAQGARERRVARCSGPRSGKLGRACEAGVTRPLRKCVVSSGPGTAKSPADPITSSVPETQPPIRFDFWSLNDRSSLTVRPQHQHPRGTRGQRARGSRHTFHHLLHLARWQCTGLGTHSTRSVGRSIDAQAADGLDWRPRNVRWSEARRGGGCGGETRCGEDEIRLGAGGDESAVMGQKGKTGGDTASVICVADRAALFEERGSVHSVSVSSVQGFGGPAAKPNATRRCACARY